jgi:molecular chaperone GrpE
MSEPKPETVNAAAPAPTPEAELVAVRKEKDDTYARLQRMAADFDNFMKRSRQEVEDVRRQTTGEILKCMLAVLDDLDRAVAASKAAGEVGKLLEGVRLVLDKFHAVLKRYGVEPVESLGRPFDPAYHEAVAVETTDKVEEHTVLEEYSRGYNLQGRLLRPARVKISRLPESAAPAPAGDGRPA